MVKSSRAQSILLFFWVTLIVPILACTFTDKGINTQGPSGNAQQPEFQWKIYTDPVYGFSIKYPSTWFYFRSGGTSANPTESNFLLFSSALGNTDIQNRSEDEEARLIVTTLPNNNGTNVDGWLTGSPLLQADLTKVEINGIEGVRIITSPENEPDHSIHIFLFLATPKRLYSLIGVISVSENSEFWYDAIIQMQNSLTISD